MAPVKINHVVSFTSQDPRYPVENLLRDDGIHPWLNSLQDRSRQLKVELQLERASSIGYIDIGNCGCAFIQVDVGRSFWPLEQPYVTMVPSTTLMTPADSKLDRNRSGVRMFKEGDFLAAALGEKWDRVRITCSQPFNKQAQFGLFFIHIRTPLDPDHSHAAPAPPQVSTGLEPAASPWLASPAFLRTFFPEVQPGRGRALELWCWAKGSGMHSFLSLLGLSRCQSSLGVLPTSTGQDGQGLLHSGMLQGAVLCQLDLALCCVLSWTGAEGPKRL
uniref:DNA-repair protein Xrcc1 N-terminal domain-containing protein n=1 Tax=Gopherus evgoodei TaxID=1825980 RepID=A0A8C4VJQ9_9SAUR